jgi:hypothetical protein
VDVVGMKDGKCFHRHFLSTGEVVGLPLGQPGCFTIESLHVLDGPGAHPTLAMSVPTFPRVSVFDGRTRRVVKEKNLPSRRACFSRLVFFDQTLFPVTDSRRTMSPRLLSK